MSPDATPSSSKPPRTNSWWQLWEGIIWGLLSAFGYTAANVFLKMADTQQMHPVWVSFVKAIPTVVLYGPVVFWQLQKRKISLPTTKAFVVLAIASVAGHYLGNVALQWSLGVVGVALTVPLCLGMLILGGAIIGRLFLHEPIYWQSAISITVLIIAIIFLSSGASEASQAVNQSGVGFPWWIILFGVVCACMSGLSYAFLGAAIRYGVIGNTSVLSTLVIVCGTGMISLFPLCLVVPGWNAMLSTTSYQWTIMLMAGLWNALAFFALTKALKLTNVTFVNSLNASQTAMAAVAGILFFNERMTWTLIVGVGLTMLGLLIMKKGNDKQAEIEQHIGETS